MHRRLAATVAAAAASLALVTGLAGCSDDSSGSADAPASQTFPVTLTSGGRTTTIDERPGRIVSLSPTATEDLFAIDAGKQVVAVDNMSTYPPEAPKTDLSGFTPNAEAVLGYKPDLVVVSNDANGLVGSLEAANVDVLIQPAATTIDDIYKQLADLGAATDNLDSAREASDELRKGIEKEVKNAPKPSTPLSYYHEVDNTYYSTTSSTFIGSVYSMFGLRNIADAAATGGNQYPQLSSEYIVSSNPDLIFLADTKCCAQSAQTVAQRPGWQNLKAVTNNGVVPLDDDLASRWSPRVLDLVKSVGDAVEAHAKG